MVYDVLGKKDKRINDNQFKALMMQFDLVDEQIKFLQQSKENIIASYGITIQNFYQRRKKLEK